MCGPKHRALASINQLMSLSSLKLSTIYHQVYKKRLRITNTPQTAVPQEYQHQSVEKQKADK